jgi:hypothetical protein
MKRSPLLLSVALIIPVPALAGQIPTAHRWAPLLVNQGETVDIDTASVERSDSSVIVWLRWDLDRSSHQFVEYRLERVELNCRALQSRVLAASGGAGPSLLLEGDSVLKARHLQRDSSDTRWHRYSRRSLGEQSVREACRRLTRA